MQQDFVSANSVDRSTWHVQGLQHEDFPGLRGNARLFQGKYFQNKVDARIQELLQLGGGGGGSWGDQALSRKSYRGLESASRKPV